MKNLVSATCLWAVLLIVSGCSKLESMYENRFYAHEELLETRAVEGIRTEFSPGVVLTTRASNFFATAKIEGEYYQKMNTPARYTITPALPADVTLLGWVVSPASHTISSSNLPPNSLDITFHSGGTYTIIANFLMANGTGTGQLIKTVNVIQTPWLSVRSIREYFLNGLPVWVPGEYMEVLAMSFQNGTTYEWDYNTVLYCFLTELNDNRSIMLVTPTPSLPTFPLRIRCRAKIGGAYSEWSVWKEILFMDSPPTR